MRGESLFVIRSVITEENAREPPIVMAVHFMNGFSLDKGGVIGETVATNEQRGVMVFESKLVPILRQGVAVIQMVFFKRLKDHLSQRHPGSETTHINMLSGAIVNDIFGTPNTEEPYATFVRENAELIRDELQKVPFELVDMMVPLTDALRIQVLCDQQEGTDSSPLLLRANDLKILLVPREIPLPARFITLVRELGNRHEILLPPEIQLMGNNN